MGVRLQKLHKGLKTGIRWNFFERFYVKTKYCGDVASVDLEVRKWFFYCEQPMLPRSLGLNFRLQLSMVERLGYVPMVCDKAIFVDLLQRSGWHKVALMVESCPNLQLIADLFRYFVLSEYGGVYKDVFSGWDPYYYRKRLGLLRSKLSLQDGLQNLGVESNFSPTDRCYIDETEGRLLLIWHLNSFGENREFFRFVWRYFSGQVDKIERYGFFSLEPLVDINKVLSMWPKMDRAKVDVLVRTGPIAFTCLAKNFVESGGKLRYGSVDFDLYCHFPYRGRRFLNYMDSTQMPGYTQL